MFWEVVVAAALAVVGVWAVLVRSSGKKKEKATLPPGSLGWPIVGETLQFFKYSKANKWMQFNSEHVAKYGRVFKSNLFLNKYVAMPAPEGNKYLFQNENKTVVAGAQSMPYSIRTLMGPNSVVCVVGDEHKRQRRLFGNFFGIEGMRRFIPQMCAIAKAHFKQHWDGKDTILLGNMSKQFAFEVAGFLFMSMEAGPELDGLNKAFTQVNDNLFAMPIRIPGTGFYRAMAGRKYIDKVSEDAIARRRQEMQGAEHRENRDLLDVLLTTLDEEGKYMTDDGIKDNIVNFLFAGHETSAYTIGMVARMLQHNPHCMEGIMKEHLEIGKGRLDNNESLTWDEIHSMKYTWAVIQETMRMEPVVVGGFRIALQDIEFGGYTIPKGWRMTFSAAWHGSEELFPNPDKFDPSRFEGRSSPQPYTYVPFGGGPHSCLGREFARLEMLIFFHYLVLNYDFGMVDPEEKIYRAPSFPVFNKGMQLWIRRRELMAS